MKLTRRSAAALIGSALMVLGACGSSESSTDTSSAMTEPPSSESFEGVTLKVGEVKNGEFAWVADTSKMFEDAPYEIEVLYFDSSIDVLEALSAGAIDIAPAIGVPALISAQGNANPAWTKDSAPFRIAASWTNPQAPGWVLLARDPSVTDIAGLSGKKVVDNRGSFGQVYWLTLAEKNGITDVEEVQLPYLDALAAYQEGSVDALITNYRNGLAIQSRGEGTIIDTSSSSIEYISISVMRSAVADDEKLSAAVEEFIGRVAEAYEWAEANKEVAAAYFMDKMSLSADVAAEVVPSELKALATNQESVTAMFEQVIAALVRAGIIPEAVDPSILFQLD